MSIRLRWRCEQMADVNISYLNRGKQLDIIVDSIGVNNLIEGLFTAYWRDRGILAWTRANRWQFNERACQTFSITDVLIFRRLVNGEKLMFYNTHAMDNQESKFP